MQQLTINFEPKLTEKYRTFADAIEEVVKRYPHPAKVLAADLNIQPGYFARMISANDDGASFPLHRFPEFVRLTKDPLPLEWLNADFYGNRSITPAQIMALIEAHTSQGHELNRTVQAFMAAEAEKGAK